MTQPRPSRTASRPDATVRRACTPAPRPIPASLASITGNIDVTGEIDVDADAGDEASASAYGVAVSAGASLGASIANADVSPTISAEVDAGAQLQAGDDISVTAQQYQNDGDGADAMAGSGAGAILVGAAGSDATSTASATVDAGVATGASLTAGDDVSLDATSNDTALAQAIGAGLGVVGVGVSIATATDAGTTDAHSDANVNLTSGDDVSIAASGVDDATADSTAASGGIVSGDGADGTATIDPTITATHRQRQSDRCGQRGLRPRERDAPGHRRRHRRVRGRTWRRRIRRQCDRLADGHRDSRRSRHHDHRRNPGRGRGELPPGPQVEEGSVGDFSSIQSAAAFPTNNTDTASASASGSAGALYGATATSSTANDSGTVTTSIANNTTLYISNAVNIEADSYTDQYRAWHQRLWRDHRGRLQHGDRRVERRDDRNGGHRRLRRAQAIRSAISRTGRSTTSSLIRPIPSLISLASSSQNALMTSGGTFPQPGSGAVTIALSQPEFSVGDHLLTPVDLVGAAPVAFDPATALSQSGGTSYIDVGPNSFYLGEPVEYQQSGGPTLSITAERRRHQLRPGGRRQRRRGRRRRRHGKHQHRGRHLRLHRR